MDRKVPYNDESFYQNANSTSLEKHGALSKKQERKAN